MFRLFNILNSRKERATKEEIAVACRDMTFDPKAAAEYLSKLEQESNTLLRAFEKQTEKQIVSLHCSTKYQH